MMEWSKTIASKCRYGEIATKIWNDWDILWEDSEDDYQGHATILAEKDGRYCFYEWWYGSCSGCDTWEAANLSDEEIEKEMRDTALWLDNKDELFKWLGVLDGYPISNRGTDGSGALAMYIDVMSGGVGGRINEIRKVFNLEPIKEKENE